MLSKKIIFAKRPVGKPDETTFRFESVEVPELNPGQVLLETIYISVDPYIRGRMNDSKSYVEPFKLNEPIASGVVAKVVESKSDSFITGDIVMGMLDWSEYLVADEKQIKKLAADESSASAALGVVGMPGLTAYFGLLDIGAPKAGETVVISGAAGAVGVVVGQIAKIYGCTVVGIAGSDEKCKYLTEELGFDHAINYKTQNVLEALKAACSKGVDIYFDNVGGEISDAVLSLLNTGARIPICGQISLYNSTSAPVGPRVQTSLLINKAMMKGFIVSQYADRFAEGVNKLTEWLNQGKLKSKENIVHGFENTPKAFIGLFEGDNIGKQIVKVK